MILEAKAQKKSRTKDVLYLNGSVNAKDFEQQETTEEVLVKENKN